MGKVDEAARKYFANNERFADAFNSSIFKGRAHVDPGALKELDATRDMGRKARDALNEWRVMGDGACAYAILGVESQALTHYLMPMRCAGYDIRSYERQASEKRAEMKKAMEEKTAQPTSREYMSGIFEDDRLLPVITLVVSLDPQGWEGPTTLHEKLFLPDELRPFVPDWHINLIDPRAIDDPEFDEFDSDLGLVLKYVKHVGDGRQGIRRMVSEDERYGHLHHEAVELLNVSTDSRLQYDPREEWVNVPNAMQEMRDYEREQGREQGREEGREEVRKELQARSMRSISEIMKSFHVNAEEAMDVLQIPEGERGFYREELAKAESDVS